MSKPIALVTGGAGFIGSHMVDLLLTEGFSVRVVDSLVGGHSNNLDHHASNSDLHFDERDIRALDASDSVFSDVKYVFHFAGIGDIVPSIDKPKEYMSVNVQGTVSILEGARRAGVGKLVYAASSSCYGVCENVPTDEAETIVPQYPYALSKYQGEQAVFHWHQVYGLPVNTIRIFNAYGTRSRTTGAYGAVFGVFLKQKLSGKPYTVVGDGEQTRDFIYVTDVARGFYLAATSNTQGQMYNLGAGNPQSVNKLIELLGGGEIIYLPKRPGEPDCTWANISKITNELGWNPLVSFEDGVSMMLDDIERWKDAPLWDKSSIEKATEGWFKALGDA